MPNCNMNEVQYMNRNIWGENVSDETEVYEILEEVKDLSGKIKDYEGEADQELIVNWIYDTLKLVEKVGKVMEEFEERFELLEESLKK
ncbi:hypothetical protein MSWAN_0378 [Methanobacterium paludis]|uniref:Uncharacterized protein n=1 Tax=Methanobacterium paludis (strain DSM 25820 / JCM 18151 / SWAN1) TaxID=868131 RepID=F6D3K4_METPW|nr:hypothetical protein MSWAN_0378 [Methanobacterium paludis]